MFFACLVCAKKLSSHAELLFVQPIKMDIMVVYDICLSLLWTLAPGGGGGGGGYRSFWKPTVSFLVGLFCLKIVCGLKKNDSVSNLQHCLK
jgi:hypothetical protein